MWATRVLGSNRPVPWRRISSWNCTMCGECCFRFDVKLRWDEAMKLTNLYGREFLTPRPGGFILSKVGGRCPFLLDFGKIRACKLQLDMKPIACKLWPFQVHLKPKYGKDRDARFTLEEGEFFVYVDLRCKGVRPGNPGPNLVETISEAVKLALDPSGVQLRTTSSLISPLIISRRRERSTQYPRDVKFRGLGIRTGLTKKILTELSGSVQNLFLKSKTEGDEWMARFLLST